MANLPNPIPDDFACTIRATRYESEISRHDFVRMAAHYLHTVNATPFNSPDDIGKWALLELHADPAPGIVLPILARWRYREHGWNQVFVIWVASGIIPPRRARRLEHAPLAQFLTATPDDIPASVSRLLSTLPENGVSSHGNN